MMDEVSPLLPTTAAAAAAAFVTLLCRYTLPHSN